MDGGRLYADGFDGVFLQGNIISNLQLGAAFADAGNRSNAINEFCRYY